MPDKKPGWPSLAPVYSSIRLSPGRERSGTVDHIPCTLPHAGLSSNPGGGVRGVPGTNAQHSPAAVGFTLSLLRPVFATVSTYIGAVSVALCILRPNRSSSIARNIGPRIVSLSTFPAAFASIANRSAWIHDGAPRSSCVKSAPPPLGLLSSGLTVSTYAALMSQSIVTQFHRAEPGEICDPPPVPRLPSGGPSPGHGLIDTTSNFAVSGAACCGTPAPAAFCTIAAGPESGVS